jgi:hypothetical protein
MEMKSSTSTTTTGPAPMKSSAEEMLAELEILVEEKRRQDALEARNPKKGPSGGSPKVVPHPSSSGRPGGRNRANPPKQLGIAAMNGVVAGSDHTPRQAPLAPQALSDVPQESPPIKTLPLLPGWDPQKVCGVPNSMLRSGLFGAIKRGPRKNLDKAQIPTLGGQEIKYTGKRLDQSDLDVYLAIFNFARIQNTPLGMPIYAKDREFLRFIGRNTGKSDRSWLAEVRTRLKANEVEISLDADKRYGGSLLQNWYYDKELQTTVLILDPLLQTLFNPGHWTSLCWEQRLALKGRQLVQWLHAFYSTHDAPYHYSVGKLRELCGSECSNLFHFRSELKEALSSLQEVTHWECGLDDSDKVFVKKTKKGG